MHSFHYKDRILHCEDVDLAALAAKHGTPLYVYSKNTILDHYRRLDEALDSLDHRICYAVKASSNLAILDLLAREGAGFDIVSGGELYRVLKAGGDASRCSFAGVGKTREEIEFALTAIALAAPHAEATPPGKRMVPPTMYQRDYVRATDRVNKVAIDKLKKDQVEATGEGVPVLSKIPILGKLFKGKKDPTKRNLSVLLQPKVVKSDQ